MLLSSSVKGKNLTGVAGDFCLDIEKVVRVGKLFDFYGSLLTDKQQKFVKLYYYHDLSLGEIAEQKNISRQAVFDNLKRSVARLEKYETKLGMAEYYFAVQEKLDKLNREIEEIGTKLTSNEVQGLQELVADLKDHYEGELE